ncbi:hypothetical protein JTY60_00710 [symbiont of Argiope bruennichi]|uniref:phosphoribosyltransferase n=1 Tax=symbiont of Argiope bruennichi TaxID=2810479 RepID=UPI003DA4CFA1
MKNTTHLFIKNQEIEEIISNLANEINLFLKNYQNETIVFVGVLKGCIFFFTDLLKKIDHPDVVCDFLYLTTYSGRKKISNHEFNLLCDLKYNVKDKMVIFVDDVVDTGWCLKLVTDYIIKTKQPKDVKIVSLLRKNLDNNTFLKIDFLGKTIENKFIFGYGLDLDEKYRNLPDIYYVD